MGFDCRWKNGFNAWDQVVFDIPREQTPCGLFLFHWRLQSIKATHKTSMCDCWLTWAASLSIEAVEVWEAKKKELEEKKERRSVINRMFDVCGCFLVSLSNCCLEAAVLIFCGSCRFGTQLVFSVRLRMQPWWINQWNTDIDTNGIQT